MRARIWDMEIGCSRRAFVGFLERSDNSLLQNNVLGAQPWLAREELRLRIVTWIERTYHRRRKQKNSAGCPPIAFEDKMLTYALSLAS